MRSIRSSTLAPGACLLTLALALVPTSCSDLEAIELDRCGNGVVDFGEDCDEAKDPGCHQTGPNACRFSCADGQACQDGFRCGLDGVCRKPSGSVLGGRLTVAGPSGELAVVDVDDDGRDELIHTNGESFVIAYFKSDRTIANEAGLPAPQTIPLVSDLNDDGIKDLAFVSDVGAGESGVAFFLGLGPSSFAPLNFPFFPSQDEGAFAGAVVNGVPGLQDFPLLLAEDGLKLSFGSTPELITENADFFSQVAGMATGPFLDNPPITKLCDQAVFGFTDTSFLELYETCDLNMNGLEVALEPTPRTIGLRDALTPLTTFGLDEFPGLRRPTIFVAHAPGPPDAHLDILVSRGDTSCELPMVSDRCGLEVAYGQGDGQFGNVPFPLDPMNPEHVAGETSVLPPIPTLECFDAPSDRLRLTPLVMEDLDGDGVTDIVYEDGIYVARVSSGPGNGPPLYLPGACPDELWQIAETGDVNGDGAQDVFVVDQSDLRLAVYINNGDGAFSAFPLAGVQRVTAMSVGDVDGDALDDVVLGVLAEPRRDALLVAFGQPTGGLSEPQFLGLFPRIDDIITGQFIGQDAPEEAFVISDPDRPFVDDDGTVQVPADAVSNQITILVGNTSRLLVAPLRLSTAEGANSPVDVSAGELPTRGKNESRPGLASLVVQDDSDVLELHLVHVNEDGATTGQDQSVWTSVNEVDFGLFRDALIAVEDLDGDGTDEVYGFFEDRFTVFTQAGPDSWASSVDLTTPTPPATNTPATACSSTGPALVDPNDTWIFDPTMRPLFEDVDGDGDLDLVVLLTSREIPGASQKLCLVTNEGGTLDYDGGVAVAAETAAFIDLDGAAPRELVVQVFDTSTGAPGIYRFEQAQAGITEDSLPLIEDGVADTMVSGDFDGDGVPDLALSNVSGTFVFFGAEFISNPAPSSE